MGCTQSHSLRRKFIATGCYKSSLTASFWFAGSWCLHCTTNLGSDLWIASSPGSILDSWYPSGIAEDALGLERQGLRPKSWLDLYYKCSSRGWRLWGMMEKTLALDLSSVSNLLNKFLWIIQLLWAYFFPVKCHSPPDCHRDQSKSWVGSIWKQNTVV